MVHPSTIAPLDHIRPPFDLSPDKHYQAHLQGSLAAANAGNCQAYLIPYRITGHVARWGPKYLQMLNHWDTCSCKICAWMFKDMRAAAEAHLSHLACLGPKLDSDRAVRMVGEGLDKSFSDPKAKKIIRLVALARVVALDCCEYFELMSGLKDQLQAILKWWNWYSNFPALRKELAGETNIVDDILAGGVAEEELKTMRLFIGLMKQPFFDAVEAGSLTPSTPLGSTPVTRIHPSADLFAEWSKAFTEALTIYLSSERYLLRERQYALVGARSPWLAFGWKDSMKFGNEPLEMYWLWRELVKEIYLALGILDGFEGHVRVREGQDEVGREMFGIRWEGLKNKEIDLSDDETEDDEEGFGEEKGWAGVERGHVIEVEGKMVEVNGGIKEGTIVEIKEKAMSTKRKKKRSKVKSMADVSA